MDVTRQRNVQMKEKTAKKLEKSFIDEQIWLLGVYTHSHCYTGAKCGCGLQPSWVSESESESESLV